MNGYRILIKIEYKFYPICEAEHDECTASCKASRESTLVGYVLKKKIE